MTSTAAFFTVARAWMSARGMRSPEIRKCWSERWVCAPHSRSAGTSMGPKVSFSIRVFAGMHANSS